MPEIEERERRRFGRIDLEEPLQGMIGDVPVSVVEVSIVGLRVMHEVRFPAGEDSEARVSWQKREMHFACHIVRSTLFKLAKTAADSSIFQSGVRLDEAFGDSDKVLRELIAQRVMRAIQEQKQNAYGIPSLGPFTYQVGKGDRYRRCDLTGGKWRKFDTTRPEQPVEGFTVSADLDPVQIEVLCQTYEALGPEGRRLTKMLAELSIRKTEGGPTRRYVP
jgi:hypothetical protein